MMNQLGAYCPICNPRPRCPCCGNPYYGYQQFPYAQWQGTFGYVQNTSTNGIQGSQCNHANQGQTLGGSK